MRAQRLRWCLFKILHRRHLFGLDRLPERSLRHPALHFVDMIGVREQEVPGHLRLRPKAQQFAKPGPQYRITGVNRFVNTINNELSDAS